MIISRQSRAKVMQGHERRLVSNNLDVIMMSVVDQQDLLGD